MSAANAGDPQALAELQLLYTTGELRQLKRLARRKRQAQSERPLQGLLTRLEQATQAIDSRDTEASFNDILLRQERALRLTDNAQVLRSGRRFQELMAQDAAKRLLNRSQRSAPQDSGPLNPQRLANEILLTMRSLSPQYLTRFAAYLETLASLENLNAKR